MPGLGTSTPSATALLYAMILGAGIALGCASELYNSPVSAPPCGWNMELSKDTLDDLNLAAPDTAAAYWVLRYRGQPTLTLTIKGHFPDARYVSFNTYDWRFQSFAANGVASSIADYQIDPDPGSVNPWRQPTQAGGSYTINVRPDPDPSEVNTLPLAPAGAQDGRDGFLIFRVYRPAGDPAAAELPKVSFTTSTGTQTFPACTTHDDNFGPAIQNVPLNATPEHTAEIMRGYYPRTGLCTLTSRAAQGIYVCPI